MPFDARCPYCRLKVKKVPDKHLGNSMDCVRCRNSFMLEPMEGSAAPPGAAQKPPPTVASLVKEIPQDAPAPVTDGPHPLVQRPPANNLGLVSFVLACFGVFGGTVMHAGLVAFVLCVLALLLGIAGLVHPVPKHSRPFLPAAGVAVSLPAVLIAAFVPRWAGMNPLWNTSRSADRDREAVIALTAKGTQRRTAKGETTWADASRDALLHGDVRLRVRSAVVGPVEFDPVAGQKPPAESCLVIGLRITNAGLGRKLPYKSWGRTSPDQDKPVLRDNNGKTIAEKSFPPGWNVKGQATTATVPPGKWIDDVLIFEAPDPGLDYLRLELPGGAAGTEGRLRMQIPKEMIRFR
jgi:hypothetical protein